MAPTDLPGSPDVVVGAGVAGAMVAPRQAPDPVAGLPLGYLDRTIAETFTPRGDRMLTEPVARDSRVHDGRPPCCGNDNVMPIRPIAAQVSGIHAGQRAAAGGAPVVPETVAQFVELAGAGCTQAAHVLRPDGSEWRAREAQIVLAADGIETPRLVLMSAQAGAPDGLGNAGGALGGNLMDHPGPPVVFDMPRPVWPGRGPQETTSILTWRDGRVRSDVAANKLHLSNGSSVGSDPEEKIEQGLTGTQLGAAVRDTAARRRAIDNVHEQLPEWTNRLTLSGRADPRGRPGPAIHREVGDHVRGSAAHAAEVYRDIVDVPGAELVSVGDGSDGFAKDNPIMGGTIMGENSGDSVPGDSVVDAETRLHGVETLRLALSSVFPSSARVNASLTVAALALRTADSVEARQRGGR